MVISISVIIIHDLLEEKKRCAKVTFSNKVHHLELGFECFSLLFLIDMSFLSSAFLPLSMKVKEFF